MRLLDVHSWKFEEFLDERRLSKYAILSHTWGDKEVQYHHMLDVDKHLKNEELDFYKIRFLCKQAIRDEFNYAWIDTCCINKESSAELIEAINSMFRWYQKSAICYVYMSDIVILEHWESKRLLEVSICYTDHSKKSRHHSILVTLTQAATMVILAGSLCRDGKTGSTARSNTMLI